jgi:cell division septum initiation protein DivIVA
MDDTLEIIRQQMTETKSQLSDKLESLEHQVSDTVQSTGTAVNDTVAAVQKTVDSVTGAVQDAVQSVSNAFDVRRQFDRHPWLVLGGALVVGYLAYELLAGSGKKSEQSPESASWPGPAAGNAGDDKGQPAIAHAATSAALAGCWLWHPRTKSPKYRRY